MTAHHASAGAGPRATRHAVVRAEPDRSRLTAALDGLAAFHHAEQPGWTRRFLSEPYRASRDWVASQMRDAGLEVHRDPVGTLIGMLPGSRGHGPAVVTGSHTDTVAGGGRFDGTIGVLGAVEAVRMLREAGHRPHRDVWVVDFAGEEPNDHGVSCVGSRAAAGTLHDDELRREDAAGLTLGAALERQGADPAAVRSSRWHAGDVRAYVELHIEQGPLLERRGVALGVVSRITGVSRPVVTFHGRADHAGTTPMDARLDAACAAAELILAVESAAGGGAATGTAGRLDLDPGAVNVVPAAAQVWLDLRSADADRLARLHDDVLHQAAAIAERRGLRVSTHVAAIDPPIPTAAAVRDVIAAAAAALDEPLLSLPSGAEHDACQMARLAPMGMIFVASAGGRSHCPEEHSDIDDIARGVRLLAETVVRLDRGMEVPAA